MKKWYGSIDDPDNPQGGTDYDNEQLSDEEDKEIENEYERRKSEDSDKV